MRLGGGFYGLRLRAFRRARSGNVAMLWALMGAMLLGMVGFTVDFTRAQSIRAQIQNAADGAALVAERSSNLPMSQRTTAARAFFDAEVGDQLAQSATFSVTQLADGGHRVTVAVPMPLSISRLIRNQDWTIGVTSEAQADASPPIEVALVLDNTGSMANDMQALRDSAEDLADKLFALDGDSVKMAVVPFVAQVNIGNNATTMAWMDTAGTSPYNGALLEDRQIGWRASGNGAGGSCQNLSRVPYSGYTGPFQLTWVKVGSSCRAFTPLTINYFQLYSQMPGQPWGGCVEARPEPYDVTDAAPSTPETRFVPYFWVDTLGSAGSNNSTNSYLNDTRGTLGPNTNNVAVTMTDGNSSNPNQAAQDRANFFNVFKYRGDTGSNVSYDNTAPEMRGPNRGCPTAITPLTNSSTTVVNGIRAMQHQFGGGTNQAEGLAWGWRVLSPGAPFTQGAAYGQTHKVIVLMSDGENTNVGADDVMSSDYSSYSHLGEWKDYDDGGLLNGLYGLLNGVLHGVLPSQYRKPINNSNQFVDYINAREAQVCANIKAQNIEIYTIIFRETDQATENIMRTCATDTSHFYRADDQAQLAEAFDAIGTGIGMLRLTH